VTWTSPAPQPADGPLTGDDRPILEGVLGWHRTTLLNICAGLTGEQLAQRPVPPSNLSLLGLVRHLAKVERIWFRERAAGESFEPMYAPELGKDADFEDIRAAQAEEAVERLQEECRLADEAVAGLDFQHVVRSRHGEEMSLRMVYVHMISEYGRHLGHADLLREAIDGVTGR
jgi:uncharacterized damage-inducible protein DinB